MLRGGADPRQITAPMAATVAHVAAAAGQAVRAGQVLLIVEAMKMEHELRAAADGCVLEVRVRAGELVAEGDVLVRLDSQPIAAVAQAAAPAPEVAAVRSDLRQVLERQAFTLDAARAGAIAKRHALGLRSARENIADLCDLGSFVEYGALAVAAQSERRSHDDLVANTPADGIVTGIGAVHGTRVLVMAYDATVLAGTQGMRGHEKTDRMLAIALEQRLPVVLFAEGGGGRPGDTDIPMVAGLHLETFARFARLSGRVPVLSIVAGRCFAGNAALAGCSDLIIATQGSNLGMGGPAMIEGGGLGAYKPEQVGPSDVQAANGVIDVLVADEAEAVAVARRVLSFFEGRTDGWRCADQQSLRDAVPLQRTRSYDMRAVMPLIADSDSLLELRPAFGKAVLTALARIEGRPVALLASNPMHLGGAIDPDAADKAARFMQLADAHALPLVSLIDTPGFMVGPEVETRAQVRHAGRMFVVAARLRVPIVSVVLRKGYGLGAVAMSGGGFHATVATGAWPSAEFGAMGLEGAVRLGYRKELEAPAEGAERDALYRELVDRQYERGKAIRMAEALEIDAVIDPATTREWLSNVLDAARTGEPRDRFIDPW